MRKISIRWADSPSDISESDWNRHLERCPRANPFHSWAFGEATAAVEGFDIRRGLVMANAEVIGLVQLFSRRIAPFCRHVKTIQGPVFDRTAILPEQIAALQAIKKAYPARKLNWCTLMPDLPDSEAVRSILSDTGLNRIMAGYRTAWLDLRKSENDLMAGLDGKWRNQLRKAMQADLTVSFSDDPSWLLARYEEHKKDIAYSGPPAAVLERLRPEELCVATASVDGAPAAAVLFIRTGNCATYQVGWSNEESRKRNAHNLLLWNGIMELKKQGVEAFDIGGVDPETAPGVAHFKAGLGGLPVTLAGTFI